MLFCAVSKSLVGLPYLSPKRTLTSMTNAMLAKLKEDPRLARGFKGGVSGIAGKLATLLVNAISLPITVRYLGPQQYGLWVRISTTVVMVAVVGLRRVPRPSHPSS